MNLSKLNSLYSRRADSDYWDDDPNHPANQVSEDKTFDFIFDHHFFLPEGEEYVDASDEVLDKTVTDFMTANFLGFHIEDITTDEIDGNEFFAKITGTVDVEVDPAYDDDPNTQTEYAIDTLKQAYPLLSELDKWDITLS